MPVARLDILDEFVDYQWFKSCGNHLSVERHYVGSLCSRSNFSVLPDVGLLESRANVLYGLFVTLRAGVPADGVRQLRHRICDEGPICCREKILVRMFVGSQPVREVGTNSVLAEKVRIAALDENHPAFHRVPVFFNDSLVAVLHPGRPRNDHSGVAPTWRANSIARRSRIAGFLGTGGQRVRRNIGEGALPILRVHNILNEFLRERSNVEVVASGSPENFCVSHPPQTLITLRTIRRDTQEITSLSPDTNRPHLIDQIT